MADRTDAEIKEVDAPSHQQAQGGVGGVKELLTAARQLVDQGMPSEDLQADELFSQESEQAEMLDRTDAEVKEADALSHQQAQAGVGGVKELLAAARKLVDQGKPSEALQMVVSAIRTQGGYGAVVMILQHARELYRKKIQVNSAADQLAKIQANSAADQLASLFAECAITEAGPLTNMPCSSATNTLISIERAVSEDKSILAESGRKQIVLDAFADASSYVCLKCGGLVSTLRGDEHIDNWCD